VIYVSRPRPRTWLGLDTQTLMPGLMAETKIFVNWSQILWRPKTLFLQVCMEHLLDFEHGLTNHRQIVCYWNRFACVMLVLAWHQLIPYVCPFVCHNLPLHRNGQMDQTVFWHRGCLWPAWHCVTWKFKYLLKYISLELCLKLWTLKNCHAPLTIVNLVQPRNIASSPHCV